VAEWAVRLYEEGKGPVWNDFWAMSEDDWRSGVAWLRQERQMRIDDATMLMLRVVDDRIVTHIDDEEPHAGAAVAEGQPEEDDSLALEWLPAAAKELKPVSEQVAEETDRASERVVQGLRGLKERALKKYRDTFGKKKPPE
jgi:hypothetical protein